ncbi:SDR family oxidoreductase [Winogradskya consettensis]|uniref:Short-chain dehydrogenase/reductase n=1 Tax=Winogradskya consettensis TaxID=113560 RepID=A0A919SF19_9ACTN|nr:SDR family NAD(P)-dependent oxidoreductase [Actinoplanes consettensis]GIM71227.1 short-chain dehydrogenase/reductase [Actinoplanes consettensis]
MTSRTWFITGISSGFGREMTSQLLQRGDRVAGTVRRPGSVDDLRAKYGSLPWVAHLDVTDLPGVGMTVDRAFAELGRIDVVVSSYGGQATNPGASLYHASKWGVEGFMEGTARDAEPGGARTEFRFDSLSLAAPLPADDGTPAAMVRGAKDRCRTPLGDPAKMAAAIVDSAEREPAPLRLVLGSDSYRFVTGALRERLAQIEPQEAGAAATDRTDAG